MLPSKLRSVIALMSLCCLAQPLFAPAEETETPWGEAVDGVACRLVLRSNYCVGEKIVPVVEFKNVSTGDRSVYKLTACYCYMSLQELSLLELTGPNGKMQQNGRASGRSFPEKDFVTISPGKTVQFVSDQSYDGDVRTLYYWGGPGRPSITTTFGPGEYKLTYTYLGPRPKDSTKAYAVKLLSNTAVFTITAPTKDDLNVHEWGVFSICADSNLANQNLKADWEALPDAFYHQFPRRKLYWTAAEVSKPIVYFYTKRKSVQVEVQVSFAEGLPVVWWPACSEPHDNIAHGMTTRPGRQPPPPKGSVKEMPIFRSLKWEAQLNTQPEPGENSRALVETELPDSWIKTARTVKDAALVTTMERERFIYYDGVVPTPDYLRCVDVTATSIRLKNAAAFALKSLLIVDRRGMASDGVRFARIDEIAPGAEVNPAMRELSAAEWKKTGESEFQGALATAGLTEAEAKSVVEIWRAGFLNAPGVTAFYILPQSEYDRLIPIKITPTPGSIVRVGIVLHSCIDGDPELRQKAKELIGQLDDADMDKRDVASKKLAEMGAIAFSELRSAAENQASAEVRARCRKLLEDNDAGSYLKQRETAPGYWDREK